MFLNCFLKGRKDPSIVNLCREAADGKKEATDTTSLSLLRFGGIEAPKPQTLEGTLHQKLINLSQNRRARVRANLSHHFGP